MQFPKSWPPDCPPADAQDAQGEHFRVASSNPPGADDFKSCAELGKFPKADPCKRVGLSLLRTLDDAIHQTKLFPMRGNLIFRGDLNPSHGKTLLTKGRLPTHTTWWPFEGIDRAAPFVFAGAQ